MGKDVSKEPEIDLIEKEGSEEHENSQNTPASWKLKQEEKNSAKDEENKIKSDDESLDFTKQPSRSEDKPEEDHENNNEITEKKDDTQENNNDQEQQSELGKGQVI